MSLEGLHADIREYFYYSYYFYDLLPVYLFQGASVEVWMEGILMKNETSQGLKYILIFILI